MPKLAGGIKRLTNYSQLINASEQSSLGRKCLWVWLCMSLCVIEVKSKTVSRFITVTCVRQAALRFGCKARSSAIDLLLEPVGRTTQTPLMTNRANTLTVISCSAKVRETATFFFFFSARQEGQIAHRSLELPNREFDFLAAQHNSVFLFCPGRGKF